MTEPEKLPDELSELFAAERAAPIADAAARVTARSRLDAAISRLPALGKSAAFGGAGKLLILVLAIAAGGGALAFLDRDGDVVSATHVVERAPLPDAPIAQRALPLPSPSPSPPSEPVALPARTAKPAPRPPRIPRSSPSQIELLRRAWTLVSAGQPREALELVHSDEQLHPDGVLAEEREALSVHALAKLQRTEAARAAAASFLVKHPTSIHRARIELVLKENP